ncbi:MAG: hypothetical protein OEM25_08350 [Gammaproteobacteria bacterium]|nr:hypothetical protein [Gammaproteobacteria bacterium]
MRFWIMAISAVLLGCGSGSTGNDRESADPDRGMSDAIHDTLDEAKAVENLLMENKDRLDDALDDLDNAETE